MAKKNRTKTTATETGLRKQLRDLWQETQDCAGATCPRTFMK